MGKIYKILGTILMRRRCFVSTCNVCKTGLHEYFPYHGAFMWEGEYWKTYKAKECCGQPMTVSRTFDGIIGALYRLPGYRAYDGKRFRMWIGQKMPVG